MSLGESIDQHFSANKSESHIWQCINPYHDTSTAQRNHFHVYMFPCSAILICADINTSKDRGLRAGCKPELQFCLLQQEVIFPHYAIWCHVHTVLSGSSFLSYPRLVNQLSQKLSCTTFNVDGTCCGCFTRADGCSLRSSLRQSHPITWCNHAVMLSFKMTEECNTKARKTCFVLLPLFWHCYLFFSESQWWGGAASKSQHVGSLWLNGLYKAH